MNISKFEYFLFVSTIFMILHEFHSPMLFLFYLLLISPVIVPTRARRMETQFEYVDRTSLTRSQLVELGWYKYRHYICLKCNTNYKYKESLRSVTHKNSKYRISYGVCYNCRPSAFTFRTKN